MIRDVFMYMDRVYALDNNRQSVYNMSVVLFKEKVKQNLKLMFSGYCFW